MNRASPTREAAQPPEGERLEASQLEPVQISPGQLEAGQLEPTQLEDGRPSAAQLEAGLDELQTLLLSGERQRIGQLETLVLDESGRTAAVSDVLLEAMVERAGRDPLFARSLRPLVEDALRVSVKRTPLVLAEILFPILGPAIRRTVAHALAAATASLSRAIDQTLTLEALRWRLEASRTGRSFGEIVLLRTLEYRVEQAYLIHRETGLVLLHEGVAGSSTPDAGLVSAMLTAIRDFAQDSFQTKENLDQFQLGELAVHVETGPMAVVAVVVRGSPPQELRDRLAQLLEGVHQHSNEALREFSGDPQHFEISRDELTELLVAAYRGARAPAAPRVSDPRQPQRIAALIAVIAVMTAGALLLAQRERSRWDGFFDDLRNAPGIALTNVSQQNGRWVLEGLRDPLGVNVTALLEQRGLSVAQVRSNLRPFASLEPVFVLKRALIALEPPSTVRLRLSSDGMLSASGSASTTWLAKARVSVTAIAGVARFNLDGIKIANTKP